MSGLPVQPPRQPEPPPSAPDNAGEAASRRAHLQQRLFERLQRIAAAGERGRVVVARYFEPLFARFAPPPADWLGNAEWALREQGRMKRARGLLYGVGITVLLLLLWAAVAPLDEVTRGEGKVIPSRYLQVVQSVDGGVVEAVFAKEGQAVKKGDLLVRIDPTRFVANLREGSVKAVSLQAKADRLKALVSGTPYEPVPAAPEDAEQALVLAQEQRLYLESRNELQEQLTQARQELNEVSARLAQAERTYGMSTRELEVTRPLLKSGAVSDMDILRLERDQSNADGERRQARARAGQLEARIREVELSARNRWRAELTDTLAQLGSLNEGISGLADKVKFAEIRSPVNGTVQRIFFNTIGGVVQPGNAVVEVVPRDDQLLVEARISPRDIAFLRPGLPAVIKFNAYDFSIYGGMQATLQHISPDTVTDDKGETFYVVRAATDAGGFHDGLPIIPGMTLQLDILTGKKTVLSYLLKPVLRAKAAALTER